MENTQNENVILSFVTPRTTNQDIYIDLSVLENGIYSYSITTSSNDSITAPLYNRALEKEFGEINIAPSNEYRWDTEVNDWVLRPTPQPLPVALTSDNTIVNTNGSIMTASPVIKLFSDGSFEPVTKEAKEANISTTRIEKGRYVISGVLGTHMDEQWAISVPESLNGLPLVWVNYRVAYQGEDINGDGKYIADMGDIILDTYHRTYPDAPDFEKNNLWEITDDEGNIIDYKRMFKLPEGINGRLVEEMEDIDIPNNKSTFLNIRVNI